MLRLVQEDTLGLVLFLMRINLCLQRYVDPVPSIFQQLGTLVDLVRFCHKMWLATSVAGY